MSSVVKVTDSMGDHWVYDGVSVYGIRGIGGGFSVPALAPMYPNRLDLPWIFPTLDAAVDAIHTHLKGGADG